MFTLPVQQELISESPALSSIGPYGKHDGEFPDPPPLIGRTSSTPTSHYSISITAFRSSIAENLVLGQQTIDTSLEKRQDHLSLKSDAGNLPYFKIPDKFLPILDYEIEIDSENPPTAPSNP
jgi:hypothetical protein